ncbi:hypothetical protein HJC23_013712 [Cyclotella cryptica]|uniref:Uncharacterized protein n=1 Tax=Cyclotella cryptica TaxID=29204 RepID=A0ABD3QVF9_9STRA
MPRGTRVTHFPKMCEKAPPPFCGPRPVRIEDEPQEYRDDDGHSIIIILPAHNPLNNPSDSIHHGHHPDNDREDNCHTNKASYPSFPFVNNHNDTAASIPNRGQQRQNETHQPRTNKHDNTHSLDGTAPPPLHRSSPLHHGIRHGGGAWW